MDLLITKINDNIIKKLTTLKQNVFDKNLHKLVDKKIGYNTIYHNNWDPNKKNMFKSELNEIVNEINNYTNKKIDNNILHAGFIYSFPNCDNQTFHYDYLFKIKATTYFIPFTKITNLNGTEYLYFEDPTDHDKYADLLLLINNQYTQKSDLDKYLQLLNTSYEFKIFNAAPFSVYTLNNIFHRGKINETNDLRVVFFISTVDNISDLTYSQFIMDNEIVTNAEIDDKACNSIFDEKYYVLKCNNNYISILKGVKDSQILYTPQYDYKNINNYLWKIVTTNNSIELYHHSGVQLTINNDINNDITNENSINPFRLSINSNETCNWKKNDNILTSNNIIIVLEEI